MTDVHETSSGDAGASSGDRGHGGPPPPTTVVEPATVPLAAAATWAPDGSTRTGPGSLADRAATVLTDEIVAGTLRPGQWVSENELAARLGVSRSPVREALRALARDGLVAVRARRGTVITELSATDVAEIYAARQVVEAEMVRLAVATLDDAAVLEMQEIVDAAKSAGPEPRSYYDAIWAAWELLAEHCPNTVVRDLTMLLWRRSIPLRGMLIALPGNRELMNSFLDRLLVTCAARDGEAAAAILRESLAQTCARVLAECFIDTDSGAPVRRRPLSSV